MSEIRTSSDFRQFSYVPFPDSSDFGQLKSKHLRLDFGHFFYLHTSDNLLPFTYSVGLNVGVSKQSQKSLLQASQWYMSEHAEIQMFCVCPKNPNCPKYERAEIRTGFCSDFRHSL